MSLTSILQISFLAVAGIFFLPALTIKWLLDVPYKKRCKHLRWAVPAIMLFNALGILSCGVLFLLLRFKFLAPSLAHVPLFGIVFVLSSMFIAYVLHEESVNADNFGAVGKFAYYVNMFFGVGTFLLYGIGVLLAMFFG